MTAITLKKIPEALHEAIKLEAEKNGRSLNKEIIFRLEQSLRKGQSFQEDHLSNAQAVRENLGVYLTQKDLETLKTQGRT